MSPFPDDGTTKTETTYRSVELHLSVSPESANEPPTVNDGRTFTKTRRILILISFEIEHNQKCDKHSIIYLIVTNYSLTKYFRIQNNTTYQYRCIVSLIRPQPTSHKSIYYG